VLRSWTGVARCRCCCYCLSIAVAAECAIRDELAHTVVYWSTKPPTNRHLYRSTRRRIYRMSTSRIHLVLTVFLAVDGCCCCSGSQLRDAHFLFSAFRHRESVSHADERHSAGTSQLISRGGAEMATEPNSNRTRIHISENRTRTDVPKEYV